MSKLVPKLRFKEFGGDWEEKLFNDIFIFTTGKNIKQNEASPEYETPCIRYGELYHMYNEIIYKIINKTNLNKSELIFSKGDEILLPSAGEDPLDIASASALTIANIAIGRTINILRPLQNNIYNQRFVSYYINHKLKRKISTLAKGSSISNVYNSDLKKVKILLPSIKEQEKIAKTLTSLDNLIESQNKKVEMLKQHKKGLMQNLFPLDGEKKPKLRFDGFSGDWKEQNFEKIFNRIPSKKYQIKSVEYLEKGKYPVIDQGKSKIVAYSNNKNKLFINDEVIVFGDHTRILKYIDFDFIVGADGTQLIKTTAEYNNKFLYYQLLINKIPNTGYNRHFKFIKDMLFFVPKKLKEQQKIANALSSLDNLIEAQTKKVETLKQHKKGLMQKLFVNKEEN